MYFGGIQLKGNFLKMDVGDKDALKVKDFVDTLLTGIDFGEICHHYIMAPTSMSLFIKATSPNQGRTKVRRSADESSDYQPCWIQIVFQECPEHWNPPY